MGERLLNLSIIAGYVVAHVLVLGFWAHWRTEYGADAMGDAEAGMPGAFLVTVVPTAPPAVVLGLFDAAARIIGHPLLKVLDALLLVLLALVWIVPIQALWLGTETITASGSEDVPSEQFYLGVLASAELSLVLLLAMSVSTRLIAGLILKRRSRSEQVSNRSGHLVHRADTPAAESARLNLFVRPDVGVAVGTFGYLPLRGDESWAA
jgi:hypothetical protein